MPPKSNNSGYVVAMCGKDCVAIATDLDSAGYHLDPTKSSAKKIFKIGPLMFLGLTGPQLEILTVRDRAISSMESSERRENRALSPQEFSVILSNFLYNNKSAPYHVEPIVAGLDPKTLKPYICLMDMIGYRQEPQNFVVAGTCESQLTGLCSALWEPDLGLDDLFQVISTAILRASDRDPNSPLGATALVYLIEKHQITERAVKMRSD